MREIRFRAWDKQKEYMFFPTELMLNIQGENKGRVEWVYDEEDLKVFDFVLMQYTGLHDKNSKEIFEGDAVKCSQYKGIVEFKKYDDWEQYQWGEHYGYVVQAKDGEHSILDYEFEIIGNIHENPELINGGE